MNNEKRQFNNQSENDNLSQNDNKDFFHQTNGEDLSSAPSQLQSFESGKSKKIALLVFACIFFVITTFLFAFGLAMFIEGLTAEAESAGDGVGKAVLLVLALSFFLYCFIAGAFTFLFGALSLKSSSQIIRLISKIIMIINACYYLVSIILYIVLRVSGGS